MILSKSQTQHVRSAASSIPIDFLNLTTAGLVILADPHGPIVFANSATSALCGYTNEELLGANSSILISEESRLQWDKAVESAVAQNISLSLEIECRRKDGSISPA